MTPNLASNLATKLVQEAWKKYLVVTVVDPHIVGFIEQV